MTLPDIPGPEPDTKVPALRAPARAADCHFHIFGPADRYPYAAGRAYTPPDTLEDDYRRMAGILGLTRGVVVQASVHETDNTRVVDAIHNLGPAFRGIGAIAPDVAEEAIEELNQAGLRGARINLLMGGKDSLESMEAVAERIKPFGWHLQLNLDGICLPEIAPRLKALPVPVVIDHMAMLRPASVKLEHPAVRALRDLLNTGRCWIKLSGAEALSEQAPHYWDLYPLAQTLTQDAPERCLWGTNWPHPRAKPPMPNDGDLFDLLLEYAPDEDTRFKILVENPERLYGFFL